MTVKLASLKADLNRENEGDWQDVPELPGVRLRVRALTYGPYQTDVKLLAQRWARQYGRKPVPQEEVDREEGKLLARHILLEWEGFDAPYDPEEARDALMDPAYRELRRYVAQAASAVAQVQAEWLEDAAKN